MQLAVRLSLVGGMLILSDPAVQAAWAAGICLVAFFLGFFFRPYGGHGLEMRVCGRALAELPSLQHEGLISMSADFCLFINASFGLLLQLGMVAPISAMYILVPIDIGVVTVLFGLQNWVVIFQSLVDQLVSVTEAPQLHDAIHRIINQHQEGQEAHVAKSIMEWVHKQPKRLESREKFWYWRPPLVTMLDWPSTDTLLHLSVVHGRWLALGLLLDQLKLMFEVGNAETQVALLCVDHSCLSSTTMPHSPLPFVT